MDSLTDIEKKFLNLLGLEYVKEGYFITTNNDIYK